MIPYVLVLIGGILGVNVFIVLLVGIASGACIMLATGQISRKIRAGLDRENAAKEILQHSFSFETANGQ